MDRSSKFVFIFEWLLYEHDELEKLFQCYLDSNIQLLVEVEDATTVCDHHRCSEACCRIPSTMEER